MKWDHELVDLQKEFSFQLRDHRHNHLLDNRSRRSPKRKAISIYIGKHAHDGAMRTAGEAYYDAHPVDIADGYL